MASRRSGVRIPPAPPKENERVGDSGKVEGFEYHRLSCFFMPYYVYILQSESTGRYYIGQTEHLEERVRYHQSNYSKAIKNRGPWKLLHFEEFPTRGNAMKRENYIKRQKDRLFIERLVSASR